MDTINSLAFIAILLIVVDSAYSLRCYNCSSTDPDRSCFDPIDADNVQSIFCNSSDSETCVSLEAFKIDPNSNETISRKYCAPKIENICESIKGGLLADRFNVSHCTSCEIDNCNAIVDTNWGNSNCPGQFVFVFGTIVLILPKIK